MSVLVDERAFSFSFLLLLLLLVVLVAIATSSSSLVALELDKDSFADDDTVDAGDAGDVLDPAMIDDYHSLCFFFLC
jgi:hypothetical protein